jgi:hypothetical protein
VRTTDGIFFLHLTHKPLISHDSGKEIEIFGKKLKGIWKAF